MTPSVPATQQSNKTAYGDHQKKLDIGVKNSPIVYIPHIRQRYDPLLHQVPQILDRRAWATPTWHSPRRERRKRTLRVCVQALRIPLAHGGRHSRGRRGTAERDESCGGVGLLLLLRLVQCGELWMRGGGGAGCAWRWEEA